METKMQVSN